MQQRQQQHAITRQINRQGGYQLKVGGVVVGSWAGGAPNRVNVRGTHARLNRVAVAGSDPPDYLLLGVDDRHNVNTRLCQHVASLARTISRNTYGNRITRSRNRRNRNNRKNTKDGKENNKNKNVTDKEQAESTVKSKDLPSNESQNG